MAPQPGRIRTQQAAEGSQGGRENNGHVGWRKGGRNPGRGLQGPLVLRPTLSLAGDPGMGHLPSNVPGCVGKEILGWGSAFAQPRTNSFLPS